jgi:hypothetical protein
MDHNAYVEDLEAVFKRFREAKQEVKIWLLAQSKEKRSYVAGSILSNGKSVVSVQSFDKVVRYVPHAAIAYVEEKRGLTTDTDD